MSIFMKTGKCMLYILEDNCVSSAHYIKIPVTSWQNAWTKVNNISVPDLINADPVTPWQNN